MGFGVGSGLFWGWGWLAGIGVIILLGLFLLPWFFFLLNLQNLLSQVDPANRKMSPGLVWLNFIPIFFLGWFIYTVVKVKDSVHAEFQSRGWYVEGDLGYNVGLTTGILWVAAHFIGWIPFIGWVLPLAGVICWIIYWLKTADLKNRLDSGPAWRSPWVYPYSYPPVYPPAAAVAPGPAAPPAAEGRAPGGRPQAEGQASGDQPPDDSAARPPEAPEPRCGACGAKYDAEDRFCRSCGLKLP